MRWLYHWGLQHLVGARLLSPMWVWQPTGCEAFSCQGISLSEWLAAWSQGRLRMLVARPDVRPSVSGQLPLFSLPGGELAGGQGRSG